MMSLLNMYGNFLPIDILFRDPQKSYVFGAPNCKLFTMIIPKILTRWEIPWFRLGLVRMRSSIRCVL